MATWKNQYSRALESATYLFVTNELDRLERQLDVMDGMIHDDEASRELKEFTEKVEVSYQEQLAVVDTEAQTQTNPINKRTIYQDVDRILVWKLEQLLKHHQYLAKKYSLILSER